jgi:hypothetical protein
MQGSSNANLDSAEECMEAALRSYYARRNQHGDADPIGDGIRKEFAGEKFMLEALVGRPAVVEILARLRTMGLKIPHCGDREPDGPISGLIAMRTPTFSATM